MGSFPAGKRLVQVACALWARPGLLAIDEPTNHVDAATRELMREVLSSFGGVGILISHDRTLLDALCSQCLFMRPRGATVRPGGYSDEARRPETLERETAGRERDKATRERDRLAVLTGQDGKVPALSSRMAARLNSNPARVLEGGRASPGEVRK